MFWFQLLFKFYLKGIFFLPLKWSSISVKFLPLVSGRKKNTKKNPARLMAVYNLKIRISFHSGHFVSDESSLIFFNVTLLILFQPFSDVTSLLFFNKTYINFVTAILFQMCHLCFSLMLYILILRPFCSRCVVFVLIY